MKRIKDNRNIVLFTVVASIIAAIVNIVPENIVLYTSFVLLNVVLIFIARMILRRTSFAVLSTLLSVSVVPMAIVLIYALFVESFVDITDVVFNVAMAFAIIAILVGIFAGIMSVVILFFEDVVAGIVYLSEAIASMLSGLYYLGIVDTIDVVRYSAFFSWFGIAVATVAYVYRISFIVKYGVERIKFSWRKLVEGIVSLKKYVVK